MAQILFIDRSQDSNDTPEAMLDRLDRFPNHESLESLTAELVEQWGYWDDLDEARPLPTHTEHSFGGCYSRATLDPATEEFHVTVYYGTMAKLKTAARITITQAMIEEHDA